MRVSVKRKSRLISMPTRIIALLVLQSVIIVTPAAASFKSTRQSQFQNSYQQLGEPDGTGAPSVELEEEKKVYVDGTVADSEINNEQLAAFVAARREAMSTGESVVVDSLTNEEQKIVAQPDGTFQHELSSRPVRTKVGNSWKEIDTKINSQADGTFAPRASVADVSIARESTDALYELETSAGKISVRHLNLSPALGTARDDAVTFPGAAQGRDVEVRSMATGIEESVILSSPDQPTNYSVEFDLPPGVQVRSAKTGLEFRKGNEVLAKYGGAVAFDSSSSRSISEANIRLTDVSGSKARAEVSVDSNWVRAKERAFPIVIDPVFEEPTPGANGVDTTVVSSTAFQLWDSADLYVGRTDAGSIGRSFVRFDLRSLNDFRIKINSATLKLVMAESTTCSPSSPIQIMGLASGFDENTVFDNQPPADQFGVIDSAAWAYRPECGNQVHDFNVKDAVRRWTGDWFGTRYPNHGLLIRGMQETLPEWHRINSSYYATGPRIYINYDIYDMQFIQTPPSPQRRAVGGVSTVPFTVKNTSTVTWPAGGPFCIVGLVQGDVESPVTCPAQEVAPGQNWTVDARLPTLYPGQYTLDWTIINGTDQFSARGVAAYRMIYEVLPGFQFGWDPYAASPGGVHTASGNYTRTELDLELKTPGPPVSMARTYNSMNPRVGMFGKGWTSPWDMQLEVNIFGATVHHPDGRQEFHPTRADGSFAQAYGYGTTLVRYGDTYILTRDSTNTVWVFDSAGKLLSIQNEISKITLSYNAAGKVQRVTDERGRYLELTWNSGNTRVTSVAQKPAGATWKYYFNSNSQLRAVCNPLNNADSGGNCTRYTYTSSDLLDIVTRPDGTKEADLSYDTENRVASVANGENQTWNYQYAKVTQPGGAETEKTTVRDPRSSSWIYEYNQSNQLTQRTDPYGKIRTWSFDNNGFLQMERDENSNATLYDNDEEGRVVQTTSPRGHSKFFGYDAQGNLAWETDFRAENASDTTYRTNYEYDAEGNRVKETLPAYGYLSVRPVRTWKYSTGGEAAVGGGTLLAGLLLEETDYRARKTTYQYDQYGRLRTKVSPSGLKTEWTYDAYDRPTQEKTISDAFPSGVVKAFQYNALGQLTKTTEPAIKNDATDAATAPSHRRETTNTYNTNGQLTQVADRDLLGGDTQRVTKYTYDKAGRKTSETNPVGAKTSWTYDGLDHVVLTTDPLGRRIRNAYNEAGNVSSVTLENYVADPVASATSVSLLMLQITYDSAGNKVTETDALSRTKRYTYWEDNLLRNVTQVGFDDRGGATRDIVLEDHTYDPDGRPLTTTKGNGKYKLTQAYDALGRETQTVIELGENDRVTYTDYDQNGDPVKRVTMQGTSQEERRFTYDSAGDLATETIKYGDTDLTTTYTRNDFGLATQVTDPSGRKSTTTYDELGRPKKNSGRMVTIKSGSTTSNVTPSEFLGYNTFGDLTHTKDAKGRVTFIAVDGLGRKGIVVYPKYTPPGGTALSPSEWFNYDAAGNLSGFTDRSGKAFGFTYNSLNLMVRQTDPKLSTQSAAGTIRTQYDQVGNRRFQTDQNGAKLEWTYDDLDRVRTSVINNRMGSTTEKYTSTYDYDDLGNQTLSKNEVGAITRSEYNAASELTKITDPSGQATTMEYDHGGRLLSTTDPLGRTVANFYDSAGRQMMEWRVGPGPNGTDSAVTQFSYDSDSRLKSVTDPRGRVTNYSYDQLDNITQVDVPVSETKSITTKYYYDEVGNLTNVIDGRGKETVMTYTPWNQVQDRTEPSTSAHPNTEDRRYRTIYDGAGRITSEEKPGGVSIGYAYDELGRNIGVLGGGTDAPSAGRAFTYDKVGNLTKMVHPDGDQAFEYDDRRLMTASKGPAGTGIFQYDNAGRPTLRWDDAGASSFTWNANGSLASMTDGLTNVAQTFSYDAAQQLTAIQYGTGGSKRTFSWDGIGRPVENRLSTSGGTLRYSTRLTYDASGNVVQKVVAPSGTAGAGTHKYAYDYANRVTSWTDPANAVTAYTYDDSGNRTRAGSKTFTFDERNRLTRMVDGSTTTNYSWTPRGTLLKAGSKAFVHDAFDRLTKVGTTTYSYDSLDRLVKRANTKLLYAGKEMDPSNDQTFKYARDPAGQLVAIQSGTASAKLVGSDAHGDLSYLYAANGTVSDTVTYDPYGRRGAKTGSTNPQVGFQGDWTDPSTGLVWMGARYYDPTLDTFTSRDSFAGELNAPGTQNRFTYGGNNPLAYSDPTGHFLCRSGCDGSTPSFGKKGVVPPVIYREGTPDPMAGLESALWKMLPESPALQNQLSNALPGGRRDLEQKYLSDPRAGVGINNAQLIPQLAAEADIPAIDYVRIQQQIKTVVPEALSEYVRVADGGRIETAWVDWDYGANGNLDIGDGLKIIWVEQDPEVFASRLSYGAYVCNRRYGGVYDGRSRPGDPVARFCETLTGMASEILPDYNLTRRLGQIGGEIVRMGGDAYDFFIGEDAAGCIDFQAEACGWLASNFIPFGKLGKLGAASRAAEKADEVGDAVRAVDDAGRAVSHVDEVADAARSSGELDEAYHYTSVEAANSITQSGLRPGTYLTPNGELGPLQASIELALPPNRALPNAVLRVDLEGLRAAGYQIPEVTRVSGTTYAWHGDIYRVYTRPGGGYEMFFEYAIPPEFVSVVKG